MKARQLQLLPFVILFLSACSNFHQEKGIPVNPLNISSTYQKAGSTYQDRLQKIIDFKPAIDSIYSEFALKNNIPGIVYGIVADDRLLYFNGFGTINISENYPVTQNSMFRIASMSKSFSAMAILKLRDEGKLSITDPAQKYVPELENLTYLTSDAPLITIENLLTMTSGLPEDNPWADRQMEMPDEEFTALIGNGFSLSNNPGEKYEYSNLGYALLGRIITVVSGEPYQDYITENILNPLGMNNTCWEYSSVPDSLLALGYRWMNGQWLEEPMLHDGAFGVIGGLITSAEDFSKYVSFLLSAYPERNEVETGPVKRSTLREMQSAKTFRLAPYEKNSKKEPCPKVLGYGYGLRTEVACDGFKNAGHSGGLPGFGSHYYFLPDYGIGIFSFCNKTYGGPWRADEAAINLMRENKIIQPRVLPVSEILEKRQKQLVEFFHKQNQDLEKKILAENFYLDTPRELRLHEINTTLDQTGEIISIGELIPENQLRGSFRLKGNQKTVEVFFSLTPEKEPKIQALRFSFVE